ncbi:hypothetical protein B0F90DRAFT_1329070 [Multifurca ochricompacta]|uniref:GATA-type domain-containing protein n=1 Tax=Multifurca ochricompacta TaxID=376703 RepID=A0AAD4M6L3_9AGAM|nr:hypothetical protein B0F90DRAFT_1329070 [Multifurca ochricompacta]
MSYITNAHRPYDSPDPSAYSHSQLSTQNARNIVNVNVTSFDPLSAQHSAQSPDHRLPKVGETRCYWTLLSSDLRFVYLDPVLSYHLVDQADLLIGHSLLEFVHPEEQTSAKNDLGNVLSTKALHGSVTRMRYSRLSRVRRLLGHQGPAHFWPDGDKIAIDSNYMAVDLVINWAAEGLVLCFIHAAVDLTPYDNDEHAKTGWTNWCGTNFMSQEQAQILYSRLLSNIPHSGNMSRVSRVFQVMMNQPDRTLLLSWPPDRDQMPLARDFAKLCGDIQIRGDAAGASDAKTTCTRRYKASSTIQSSDGFRDVESVYIPHGSIIFACHSVSSDSGSASETTASLQQAEYDASYMTQGPQYYPQTTSYGLPPMQPSTTYSNYLSQHVPQNSQPTPSQITSQYSSQQGWSPVIDPSPPSIQYNHWSSNGAQPGSPAYHSSSQQPRQQPSYTIHQSPHWSTAAFPDADSPLPPSYRSLSPGYTYSPPENNQPSAPSTMEAVPPPRGSRRPTPPGSVREHPTSSGRASGNPPIGISRCSSCKVTTSPEWRKGPSGKKDLCNACGLRYARSRAKKEGITTQRRRKEKVMALAKQEAPSSASACVPPISVPYNNNFRRSSYDDATFLSSSAGSASGSEVYSQSQSLHGPSNSFDGLTPSPSPPAGSVPFSHYNPQSQSTRQADSRGHYTVQSGSTLYPSPLSHPPLQSQGLNHAPPPLPPLPLVLNRASPILSSTSSDSALSSAVPASFERERHRDPVALPQVPLSDSRRIPSSKTTFVTQ